MNEVERIETLKKAVEEYRKTVEKLRIEHREKINNILKEIDKRKLKKIKVDLGIE